MPGTIAEVVPFRECVDAIGTRAADEIALPELVGLARVVLRDTPLEDPVVGMARVIGLGRLHADIRARLEEALQKARETMA